MIITKDLTKKYTTDEIETTALDKVNLEIQDGEFIAIMGPSGCGKSTLLNLLGLLDNPSEGNLIFSETDVSGYSENKRADIRKKNIGFVFQNFNLIEELTVYENVELPLLYQGVAPAERKKQVGFVLGQMNIAHRKDHYPLQLSGGQQQRVAICRAVVSSPKVILADEPTGNLDSKNGQEVMELLAGLNQQGTTIVMVTHSPIDADYARRLVHLYDGHIVSEEYMKKIKSEIVI